MINATGRPQNSKRTFSEYPIPPDNLIERDRIIMLTWGWCYVMQTFRENHYDRDTSGTRAQNQKQLYSTTTNTAQRKTKHLVLSF